MVLREFLPTLKYIIGSEEADFIDRLNSFITQNILIAFFLTVSFKQFGSRPIECIIPYISDIESPEEYVENFCWTQDLHFIHNNTEASSNPKRITYYKWIPFLLILSAIMFRLPYSFWSFLSDQSEIKLKLLMNLASDPILENLESRERTIRSHTNRLMNFLHFRARSTGFHPSNWAYYLTTLFFTKKVLYLINIFFQVYFMGISVRTDGHKHFGFEPALDIINGETDTISGLFPTQSHCDINISYIDEGHSKQYPLTVQCALTINMFNEKIYIFLLFWFHFLLILTCVELIYSFILSIMPYFKSSFLERRLQIGDPRFNSEHSKKNIEEFISFLGADGMLIISTIARRNVYFGTDLIASLWGSFLEGRQLINQQVDNLDKF